MEPSGELLVDLGVGSSASCVAWCPVNGLVAVGARVRPDMACVHLLNVHCVTRKVTLFVPLQGPADGLAAVAWSPSGCRRVLLVATLFGKLSAWTQQPSDPSYQARITVEDWWPHSIADLPVEAAHTYGSSMDVDAPQNGSSSNNQSKPHLVAVRWLEPAPPLVWDSAVQQKDIRSGFLYDDFLSSTVKQEQSSSIKQEPGSIEAEVAAPALQTDGEFHWVRPGKLALAAVLSTGAVVLCWAQWAAYGQLHWNSTASMALAPPGSAVQMADVTTSSSTGVAICYTLQQGPAVIHLAEVQGNPEHAMWSCLDPSQPVQLPVVPVATYSPSSLGGCVTALSWDPASSGNRLACITQQHNNRSASAGQEAEVANESLRCPAAASSATLTLFKVRHGQLVQEAQVECNAAVEQQQLAWLLDGFLVCSGAHLMQLYHLEPLQLVATSFEAPACRNRSTGGAGTSEGSSSRGVLCAVAASPHGVGVAALLDCHQAKQGGSSSSRLLLYNVPALSAPSTDRPKAVAWRLLWALQQQKHSWDIVQHVLCASRQATSDNGSLAVNSRDIQPSVVGEILSLVDTKFAAQLPTLKSTFSMRWDVLKLAVLAGTPAAEARIVSMDLRMRCICNMLRLAFEFLKEDSATRLRDQRPPMPALQPLFSYMSDVMAFNIACLKTWAMRRAGTSPAGGKAEHVPCVRNFLDYRTSNMISLLYVVTGTAVNGTQNKDDPLYNCVKTAFKAAPPWKDHNWEPAARTLFPGKLQLHYGDALPEHLGSLSLPPEQLMAHMESSEFWEQQQPLSDAEIYATGIQLGLLPARPQKAVSMYMRELEFHGSFRLKLQQDPAADAPVAAVTQAAGSRQRSVSMKRHRWQQQVGDAMGDALGAACGSAERLMSLAQLSPIESGAPGCLLSVDGAAVAAEGSTPLDNGAQGLAAAPRTILDQCALGWVYACPITGEMWIRSAC